MIDISASYHEQPCYEDVLASVTGNVYEEHDFSDEHDLRYLRSLRNLRRKLKKERVWIDGWHIPSSRSRKLPWYDEIVAIMKDATDKGAQLHRKIYLDALRRAEQPETKGTPE